VVKIARRPQVRISHLAILYTADADDLLRCDALDMIRLIITRAVRHLATATLGMIGGDAFRAVS